MSVALNLAEGTAKSTLKDRIRFYGIALASLRDYLTLRPLPWCQGLLPDSLSY